MQNNRSTDIKVGAVSLLAIIILIFGISFGNGISFSSGTKIKLRFPNSGSIDEAAPVLVNGVKRGNVKSVKSDNGSVLITAEIDNADDLHSDASARITLLEITGGKKIEIMPGKSGRFNPAHEIPGSTPKDLADIVASLGGMMDGIDVLLNRADTTVGSINQIFADGSVDKQLKSMLENGNNALTGLTSLLNNNMGKINSVMTDASAITAELRRCVGTNEPKVSALIERLDATLRNADSMMEETKSAVAQADVLLSDMSEIGRQIKSGNGTAGKLIYDEAFANQLDSALTELTALVRQLKKYGINANVKLGHKP